jgi:branched-chain amino acid transport system ATP-binding protein
LLKTVLGLLRPEGGDVQFDGRTMLGMPAHERVCLGIGYMPEDRGLVGALSVRQNLAIPVWARGLHDLNARMEQVCAMVPELHEFMDSPALSLSGGQQKLVALGRALMCGEKLLLLDEPFEGVSPVLSQRLVEAVGRARASGVSILLAQSDRKGQASDFDRLIFIERGANVSD